MMARQQKERDDEHKSGIHFGQVAKRDDQAHWKKEAEKKKKQHEAALIYQAELDKQLSALRNSSMQSLSKTMSDREQDMNEALLRKYNISKTG